MAIPEGYEAVVPEGYEAVEPEFREAPVPSDPLGAALDVAGSQMQNVAEGAMLGWRDEAEALLTSQMQDVPYNEALARIEARRAEANIGNEYEMAAKLAGGLFTGAATGMAVAPSTVVGTAALGGLEGAIAGAGLSEGTLADDPTRLATDALIGGAIGGVAGPVIGAMSNLAYRGLRPMSQRVAGWIRGTADDARMTTHQRNLQTARELEIPTTAPERLGDDALMAKQARYESDEILQEAVNPTLANRQARVNQIAREEVGLPQGDDINRFDLGQAAKDIRGRFKSIEGDYAPVRLNDDLMNRLDDVVATRGIVKPPEKAVSAVNRTMELLDDGMSGAQYLQQRSQIDKEIQAIYKSANPDVRLAETYADIIEILDDEFASQLSGQSAATLRLARKQWKNLRLLDRPNAVQGGDVRLGGIKTGLNRNKGFLRGMDETPLARLADLADSTKFNFGRSGTAERSPFNLLQRAQSTLEMPFANATIQRGGLIPGLTNIPGASSAGGMGGATFTPPLILGTEDELKL